MPRPAKSDTATLLLSCRDQRGLVAAVSQFLHRHRGNIVHADQHTDAEKGLFLQRVEWELRDFRLSRTELPKAFGAIARRFVMRWRVRYSADVPRVAVLVTKQSHCLYDLLSRWQSGEFRAQFPLVIGNHPDLRPVADHFGVPFHSLPIVGGRRAAQEREIARLLSLHRIDLAVLARYMQVLSAPFVGRYAQRLINIHHSFLPAFAGAKPYHQAHARGVKIIGATAHYVTPALDAGPIIAQDVARVSHRDSVEDLVRKGRDLEKIVLSRAVALHLANRVVVYGNKTVVFD